MKTIIDTKLGADGGLKLEAGEGKLAITVTQAGADGGAAMTAYVNGVKLLEDLKAKTQNPLLLSFITVVEGALSL